ncbi:hypothetical protein BDV98DRAFT_593258 [Pterulicium gracile]|uniref:F-box domain-containing protein n=1 Tax=Pterulicium gracile TaxID=1884261 RepID=A0A5C3QMC7_9AGAR|nr:hypothetical protein BDV98DRAFT_593258 [Pterula gracilis]
MRSQESRFPLELLDEVLCYTHHPPEDDLASEHRYRREFWLPLSLVCVHFRQCILPLLFSSLLVHKYMRDDESYAFDLDFDATCPSTVSFCRAVAAGDPAAGRMARLVKTFTIYNIPLSIEGNGPHIKLPPVYVNALSHMSNVETIFIRGSYRDIAPGSLTGRGFLDILPKLSKLSTLSVIAKPPLRLGASFAILHFRQLEEVTSIITRFEFGGVRIHDPQPNIRVMSVFAVAMFMWRSARFYGQIASSFVKTSLETVLSRGK